MDLVVRAFRLREGREEELEEFSRQLSGPRAQQARDFYRRYGVARESWHVQRTPVGTWIICVTEIPDRPVEEAAEEYAASETEFDDWFKNQVERLTGINPGMQPLGPPTECVFDTKAIGSGA